MKLCTNESLGGNTMSCVASPHRTCERGIEASGRAQYHAQVASLQFCSRGGKVWVTNVGASEGMGKGESAGDDVAGC